MIERTKKSILDYIGDTKEAAELWGMEPNHLKHLAQQKKIDAKKIGNSWAIDLTQESPKKYKAQKDRDEE